jgi:hypothetical protein
MCHDMYTPVYAKGITSSILFWLFAIHSANLSLLWNSFKICIQIQSMMLSNIHIWGLSFITTINLMQ